MSDSDPLKKVGEEIQEFINEISGEAMVLVNAVLAYEVMKFDDEGVPQYDTYYCLITPNTSPAASIGVLSLALDKITFPMAMTNYDEEEDSGE